LSTVLFPEPDIYIPPMRIDILDITFNICSEASKCVVSGFRQPLHAACCAS